MPYTTRLARSRVAASISPAGTVQYLLLVTKVIKQLCAAESLSTNQNGISSTRAAQQRNGRQQLSVEILVTVLGSSAWTFDTYRRVLGF